MCACSLCRGQKCDGEGGGKKSSSSGSCFAAHLFPFFFFFLMVLGFEFKASTLSHSTSPFFVKDFSIRSRELLAQAGFEP
jgi:hypothetical protein